MTAISRSRFHSAAALDNSVFIDTSTAELCSARTSQRLVPTQSNSQRVLDRASDVFRKRLHLVFRLRFHHDSRQRFRA
jgi:hypothetical protein